MALALLALWALQAGRRGRFALLTVLVARGEPRGVRAAGGDPAPGSASRGRRGAPSSRSRSPRSPLATAVELLLAAPLSRRRPVPVLAARVRGGLCLLRARHPPHLARATAGMLRWIYVVYLIACTAAYLVPSSLGENIARLRYAAIPIAILTLSLRRWRPLPLALLALVARGRVEPDADRRRASSRRARIRPPTRRTGLPRSSSSAATSHHRTASRRSTPSATGPPPISPQPGSRSRAAGSGRTTSPQRRPLHEARPDRVPRVASLARGAIRGLARRAARLQRETRRGTDRRRPLRPPGRVPLGSTRRSTPFPMPARS